MSRWFSPSISEAISDLARGSVSTDVLSSGPLAACTGLALSPAVGSLSVADSGVCANVIAGIDSVIATATSTIRNPVVNNWIIPPSQSTSRSCLPQSVLSILSRRLRGYLTKRKKPYVKEIGGPQEGVGLKYTLA